MKAFAILSPKRAFDGPEGVRVARLGFSLTALIFAPLWLLAHAALLALAVYIVATVLIWLIASAGLITGGAALGLFVLLHLYFAIDGGAWIVSQQSRMGRRMVDLIYASRASDAERAYFGRAPASQPKTSRRPSEPRGGPDVIGAF